MLLRQIHKLGCFRIGRGEGLVHDYISSRKETLLGKWVVGNVRCGDDDGLDFVDVQQLVHRLHNLGVGIESCSIIAATLKNGAQPQSRHSRDNRSVKYSPGKTAPDQPNVDHVWIPPRRNSGEA